MPSPIGHALGGVAAAWSAERLPRPERISTSPTRISTSPTRVSTSPTRVSTSLTRVSTSLTLLCALLAVLPDADLLYPPIHRTVTHSLGAVVLVTIIAAGVTGWVTRRIDWRTALICGLAYASHILLDWLGVDPSPPFGIQALWPFSHRWFIAGWQIFPGTERREFLSAAAILTNLKAVAVETMILGPVVALLWWGRRTTASGAGK
jgi:inner membrane protein